jgi:spiro-SPASM protein
LAAFFADNTLMNAIVLCYAGQLSSWAFEPARDGKSAFSCALENAAAFPCVREIALFTREGERLPAPQSVRPASGGAAVPVRTISAPAWNTRVFFTELSRASEGFDFSYLVWADCPFLDVELASLLAARHQQYPAEYTYADGWPYGLAPELFAPGVLGVLAKLNGDAEESVERDTVFSVLQKDIKSFDIETEISPEDLRMYRAQLCADSKRNALLVRRFTEAGYKGYADAGRVIAQGGVLRTLPAYYAVQVARDCPQDCVYCPYPRIRQAVSGEFMPEADFGRILDAIAAFSEDAVIGFSLWGEAAAHPAVERLIGVALERPGFSLVVETSGIGWKDGVAEACAARFAGLPRRHSGMEALSWVVSLDAASAEQYARLRPPAAGAAASEAQWEQARAFASRLIALFPKSAYVQAVRFKGNEGDIEAFYKHWKALTNNVIVQKYDVFCGAMPDLRAADISPVTRDLCWHLARDMYILLDGTVPQCRECAASGGAAPVGGNVFRDTMAEIWERAAPLYQQHCLKNWRGVCADCDEYYTFNF